MLRCSLSVNGADINIIKYQHAMQPPSLCDSWLCSSLDSPTPSTPLPSFFFLSLQRRVFDPQAFSLSGVHGLYQTLHPILHHPSSSIASIRPRNSTHRETEIYKNADEPMSCLPFPLLWSVLLLRLTLFRETWKIFETEIINIL